VTVLKAGLTVRLVLLLSGFSLFVFVFFTGLGLDLDLDLDFGFTVPVNKYTRYKFRNGFDLQLHTILSDKNSTAV
jgi:hypothetical protein